MTVTQPFFRRLLCLCLAAVLLLGVAGCNVQPATTGPSQSLQGSTGPTTQPTTQPTTPPTTAPTQPATEPTEPPTEPTAPPTEPTEPPYVAPSYPNLPPYELTQEDIDLFYTLLSECETLSLAGEDMAAIEASSDTLDEQYEYLNTQCSIAMIYYYANQKDEVIVTQYLDCVEICTDANDAYIQMVRRVYESDTPAKELLFEDWTEEDIAQLLAYDSRVAELQKRNEEIETEYESTSSDAAKIELYIELIQNNNEIARIYGYDNYYTYASEQIYDRDYSAEDLQLMRQYAKAYLGPNLKNAYDAFYNKFYALSALEQSYALSFLNNNYNASSKDYVSIYLDTMPENLRNHTQHMLESDSLFMTEDSAHDGAFTTTIGERSFCYFGPGYASCNTVVHEAGHYYASRYMDLGSIPLDLAEVHSQGNEMLFITSMNGILPEKRYEAIVNYQLFNNLWIMLVGLMVDEFEQQVYSVDVSNFTASDFNNIMNQITAQYGTDAQSSKYLTDMNSYWRQVVVRSPVYYVSYAVSAIAAVDLYTVAQTDYAAAVEIYTNLCENASEELGFLGNITAAGLSGPFQEEFYIAFAALFAGEA